MELRVAIPVNMQPDRRHAVIGNHVSMIFAKIPVGERDPLSVLDRTRESLALAKESHMAQALESILDLAEWTPRILTRRLTRWAVQSHPANLVVTNIPGPRNPLYLLKSRLLAAYPIVPLMPGQTLAVAVLSYGEGRFWGFHADQERFPDLSDWSKMANDAFEELYSAALRP